MAIQVLIRRTCYECERLESPRPDCPECKGTGWVEFWHNLEWLARSIREGEPIEPMVNLDRLGL
jgi:primosomal protein N'